MRYDARYTLGSSPGDRLGDPLPRPDFALIGSPRAGGGVELMASATLSEAELRHRVDTTDVDVGEVCPVPVITSRQIVAVICMADFVIVWAPDYPAAFAALFDRWHPPGPGGAARALPGGPPRLEG